MNPRLPEHVLTELSKDLEGHVRYCVAGNPNAPIECLVELSDDKFYEIRVNVALNPSCPIDVLDKLSEDELDIVAKRARESREKRSKE
jgi:hypothetical protein